MEILEYMISLPSLGGAVVITLLNIVRIWFVHNKNNIQESAETYVSEGNFTVLDQNEVFVRSYTTKTKIANSDDKK